jgi:hypothetical protein
MEGAMKRRVGGACVIALAIVLGGCKGKDSGAGGGSGASASGSAPIVGGGGAIGIKECDDYLAKVNACLEKDREVREQNEQQVKAQTENWKAMAANNKEAATNACKTALENFALIFPTCK